ncbi:MAG TPA: hypothetical protein ENF33_02255 [Nitrososphaeria archaeon]|nr:hypothetical protein [Nitrososphaeria archaeon]
MIENLLQAPLGSFLTGLILALLGLVLVFAGKGVIKFIAFLVGGIVGGLAVSVIMAPYLGGATILAGIIGFILIGALTQLLLPVGAGLVAAALTYLFLKPLLGVIFVLIFAIVMFFVVLMLFNKILAVGTAFLGSLIFLAGIQRFVSLDTYLSLLIIVALTAIGCIVQLKS